MSDGLCDFTLEDCDDPAEIFRAHLLTARVAHKCDECGTDIAVGERFERVAMRYNEQWSVFRSCLPCREISTEFHDGSRVVGVLWDGLADNWSDGAPLQACLNRLTSVAAKTRMRERWMRWKGITT